MKPSSLLLFDLDDTLIDRSSHIPIELRHLDGQGHAPRPQFFAAWNLHFVGQEIDQASFVDWLCARLVPNPQLLQLLASIPHKGIVSNGGHQSQWAKLRASGLDQVFSADQVFVSGNLPWAKPDPQIFQHACQSLGFQPQDTLYIGDHPPIDEPGALQAGLRFLHTPKPLTSSSLQELLTSLKDRTLARGGTGNPIQP